MNGKYLLIGIVFLFFVTGCTPVQETSVDYIPSDAQTVSLAIEDMTCQSCALGLEYELEQLEGVYEANVDYTTGVGEVSYDPSVIDTETIAAGSTIYPASVVK
jgi:copper chaperone CopZ